MDLKSLAQELKLSQTTVSRALNGYPEVSEATRTRVQEAARTFGYRPNSRAKGLATGRAMVIGHVIPTNAQHETLNPIFVDFILGASEVCLKRNYDMMISRVDAGDQETAYRALKSKGAVDGVILHGPSTDDHRIKLLNKIGLPFIVHGRSSGVEQPYSWLDVNNMSAFERATEFLIDLGHKRIALINGLENMDFAYRRRAGYFSALKKAGIQADENLVSSAEMTEIYGYQRMVELMKLPSPPTGVLAASVFSALGAKRAIDEAGLLLGRDISIVTHDDDLAYLRNGQGLPVFTATRSSVSDAGRVLADMLIDIIQDPDGSPKTKLLEAELIVGRSTGRAPHG